MSLNTAVVPSTETSDPGTAGTPLGFLASTRKRACGNYSLQLDPANVGGLFVTSDDDNVSIIPPGSQSALFTVESANGNNKPIRFWSDGTWPTTVEGMPGYDGMTYEIQGLDDLNNLRFISIDGGTHVIQLQFFSYI